MGDDSAGFWQFIRAFWPRWFSLMSGGLSVPLAIAAALVPDPHAQAALGGMAVVAFVSGAYAIWRAERQKVLRLETTMKPKLKCVFDHADSLCDLDTHFTNGPRARYLRMRVETLNSGHVPGCAGRMVRVIAPSGVVKAAGLSLPFAQAESPDAVNKHIHDGIPEYLDIITILEDGRVFIPVHKWNLPNAINADKIFADLGDYALEIAVITAHAPTLLVNATFRWTGDWRTAAIVKAETQGRPRSD
jgi:hypothetical protein